MVLPINVWVKFTPPIIIQVSTTQDEGFLLRREFAFPWCKTMIVWHQSSGRTSCNPADKYLQIASQNKA